MIFIREFISSLFSSTAMMDEESVQVVRLSESNEMSPLARRRVGGKTESASDIIM